MGRKIKSYLTGLLLVLTLLSVVWLVPSIRRQVIYTDYTVIARVLEFQGDQARIRVENSNNKFTADVMYLPIASVCVADVGDLLKLDIQEVYPGINRRVLSCERLREAEVINLQRCVISKVYKKLGKFYTVIQNRNFFYFFISDKAVPYSKGDIVDISIPTKYLECTQIKMKYLRNITLRNTEDTDCVMKTFIRIGMLLASIMLLVSGVICIRKLCKYCVIEYREGSIVHNKTGGLQRQ